MLVPACYAQHPTAWMDSMVNRLVNHCYPVSLRLIENSRGQSAEMLACSTALDSQLGLHCIHRNKNSARFVAGQRPRFCRFVQYTSAHANSRKLMRNTVLGVFHRMHQDTLAADVPHLLHALLCYQLELLYAGFPLKLMASVFRQFLLHPKVRGVPAWQQLYAQFCQILIDLWDRSVTCSV